VGRFIIAGLAVFCLLPPALAQEIHFSPEERLDAIDATLIATARSSIDLASYALTDPIVLDALNAAERRGVVIRIVLDPRERHDFVKLGDLSDNVRIKRGGPFMHLKAYEIDGTLLRTGSANFSTIGESASYRHPRPGRGRQVRCALRAHVGRGPADDRVWPGDKGFGAEMNSARGECCKARDLVDCGGALDSLH
jgi:PLD-like domain